MRLSEIPFPCDSYEEAITLYDKMRNAGILLDTRGDFLMLSLERGTWYVIVKTGNIRGMISDLEFNRFL